MMGKRFLGLVGMAVIIAIGKAALLLGADQHTTAGIGFWAVGVVSGWVWFSPETKERADHG